MQVKRIARPNNNIAPKPTKKESHLLHSCVYVYALPARPDKLSKIWIWLLVAENSYLKSVLSSWKSNLYFHLSSFMVQEVTRHEIHFRIMLYESKLVANTP